MRTQWSRTLALLVVALICSGAAWAEETADDDVKASMAGTWNAAETKAEKKKRIGAIGRVTVRMSPMRRNMAKQRLEERTTPSPVVGLDFEGSTLLLAGAGGSLPIELGGDAVDVNGQAQVKAWMDGAHLIVRSRSGDNERTSTYRLSEEDEAKLMVDVVISNSQLPSPLKFTTTYQRAE